MQDMPPMLSESGLKTYVFESGYSLLFLGSKMKVPSMVESVKKAHQDLETGLAGFNDFILL
ncbi:hypothetical protein J2Z28_005611 [Paenibacillus xylanexedens]|uniref:Uncharacterized protein n=1 Tax=Paenibacillus xylanexedens TaxID=528191 RepID=A0ABS4S1B6_PAEXY|nr:hypothetical protein [Paenibacillus xylanexedens]